ncbi:MAG: HAD-IA family hydrolase [Magnetococcales bacterium]|nr:HAD-IA family hydrolase [Magnetococcales bacterium]
MTARFGLVIFDCDGTLVDSLDGIARAARLALEELGMPRAFTHARIAQVVGLSLDEAMEALLPECDREVRQRAVLGYKRHYLDLVERKALHAPLFPGVRETLLALRGADVALAIATGKSMRGLERTLQEHDLADFFQVLMTADQAPSKPHPAMVETILRATGFSASQTLMVGDTLYDLEMGRNAGVKIAAVTYGCHPREQLARAQPDHWLDDLTELLPLMGVSVSGDQGGISCGSC